MTTNETHSTQLSLDALIERARIQSAASRSNDAAIARVVRLLSEGDGFAPVVSLLAEGVPRQVIADLVAEPTDKRARAKARLTIVGGDAWVHLTSTGWQAAGRASGKERAPDAMSAQHALFPARCGEFFAARRTRLATAGLKAEVVSGAAVRRFSEEVKARAWAGLRAFPDATGSLGLMTGGWLPDALLVTRYPMTPEGRALYQRLWGFEPTTDDDLAEAVTGLEAEDARKANEPLRSKVSTAAEGIASLGVVQSVTWVVRTRDVADRLRDLGVDDPARQARQFLVPATALGMSGDEIGPVRRPWWPLAVPQDDGAQ